MSIFLKHPVGGFVVLLAVSLPLAIEEVAGGTSLLNSPKSRADAHHEALVHVQRTQVHVCLFAHLTIRLGGPKQIKWRQFLIDLRQIDYLPL